MKTIGLLGGMSWESSLVYYRILNQAVRARLGGTHSARCVLVSVDFAPLDRFMELGEWDQIALRLQEAARQVEAGGADLLLLCTNTMHKLADEVQSAVSIPLLHIAEAAGKRIQQSGLQRVGLLGTRFTMREGFYSGYLRQHFDLDVILPPPAEQEIVDRVIFAELVRGQVLPESRQAYRQIIEGLAQQGAQGILLGCTEIGLLVKTEDSPLPLFDTALIHAETAVEMAFKMEIADD